MKEIIIKNQDDLDEIINDAQIDGKFITFYEMLLSSLEQYSDEQILKMRDTLHFMVGEDDARLPLYTGNKKIDELNKMEVIYYYAQLL